MIDLHEIERRATDLGVEAGAFLWAIAHLTRLTLSPIHDPIRAPR